MNEHGRNTYFADLSKLPVRKEVLDELWAHNTIAVPLPKKGVEDTSRTDYQKNRQRWAVKYFHALAEKGGYAWVRAPRGEGVKAGRVRPVGTGPEDFDAVDDDQYVLKLGDKVGHETRLKTLRLEDVVEVGPDGAMGLRAIEPMTGYFDEWYEVGARLAALVERRPVERRWANLRPEVRLAVAAEFLRHHGNPHYPRLGRMLLPVADRDPGRMGVGPYHVDVHGIGEDGVTEVLAQVPLVDDNMKYNVRMRRKLDALRRQAGLGRDLVCFSDFEAAVIGGTQPSGGDPLIGEDGVLFVPVGEVVAWVEDQPEYAERVFSA